MSNARKIKDALKKKFPHLTGNSQFYYLWALINDYDGREHYIKKGSKNEDTYFIIRPRSNGVEGLMSILMYILQRIDYARKNNWIPVVDMKNYNSQYYDGKNNFWEFFFEQLSGSSLKEAYSSKNVLLSGYTWKEKVNRRIGADECIRDPLLYRYCTELLNKNIHFTSSVNDYIAAEEQNINPGKCIGVYVRGTDYVALKPSGEPIQPTAEEVIRKVDQFIDKYKCKRIFLVTEDESIYSKFKKHYGSDLLICSFDSHISNYDGKTFLSKSGVLDNDKKKLCLNYLTKIIVLSHCKYFVGSITKGSIAALLFNNNMYMEKYVFDIGNY